MVKAWENIIATSVWIVVALHLLDWLPAVLQGLDGVAMKMGDNRVSLLAAIKLILAISMMWVLALWLARLIENRISRAAYVNPGMQVR
jgi:small-conductance mechanosensitive channel